MEKFTHKGYEIEVDARESGVDGVKKYEYHVDFSLPKQDGIERTMAGSTPRFDDSDEANRVGAIKAKRMIDVGIIEL